MALTVLTTTSFDRVVKSCISKDKKVRNEAVMDFAKNLFICEEKRGDLIGGVFTNLR